MAETTPASYRALLAVPAVGRVLLGMHLALVGLGSLTVPAEEPSETRAELSNASGG
jgi:hypothetical protein